MFNNPSTYYIYVNNTTAEIFYDNFRKPLVFSDKSVKIEKIYVIKGTHADFFNMLSVLLEDIESLESAMKDYYNYALDASFQYDYATEKAQRINTLFKKLHPFFNNDKQRFIYITNKLLRYCKKMKKKRLIDFLHKNNKEYGTIPAPKYLIINNEYEKLRQQTLAYVESQKSDFFNQYERTLAIKLLSPFFKVLDPDKYQVNEQSCDFKCHTLWRTYVKLELENDNLNFCINEYDQTKEQQSATSYLILSQLADLSNQISEYFSITAEIDISFPNISHSQIYALFLTNHYFINSILNSCKFYPEHQCIYEACRYVTQKQHVKHGSPGYYIGDEIFFSGSTDNLYENIKDSFESDPDTKAELAKKVDIFYPHQLLNSGSIKIIGVEEFEQIIALEFLYIIKNNYTIKKCAHPQCKTYFMTSSRKTCYCSLHQSHVSYQKKYKESQNPLHNRFYDCFNQRVYRTKDNVKREELSSKLKSWNQEAKSLSKKYNSKDRPMPDEYEKELIELSIKYGFQPPRSYKKQS